EHSPRASMRERRARCANRVLSARRERGNACAGTAVVLPPIAVAAAPHLVDPPFRNFRAELRLVMDDGRFGEVAHLPARLAQAKLQIDLFGVEEELLVEQPD